MSVKNSLDHAYQTIDSTRESIITKKVSLENMNNLLVGDTGVEMKGEFVSTVLGAICESLDHDADRLWQLQTEVGQIQELL